MSSVLELVSLGASIASLVLAILAIWLSISFYKMSDQAAKKADDAAKNISSSVQKLENIFDKLYSDTFSMMRDTVSDMRTHIWKQSDVKNTEKVDLRKDIKQQIEKEISVLRTNDVSAYGDLLSKIEKVVDEAFKASSTEEISDVESLIIDHVLNAKHITLTNLGLLMGMPVSEFVKEVFNLRLRGYLYWDGLENELGNDDEILPGEAVIKKPNLATKRS